MSTQEEHLHRDRVIAASVAVNEATRAREKAILEAHRAGASLRSIATWTGMNHETVRTIIKRRKEATGAR